MLASFPGPRRGGEKGLVSTVCACAIPPAPRTFDSCPYPCDVKADTKRYVVRTVIVVSVSTNLDCALSYALQRLATPILILKPEQRSVIESICNGKDTFVSVTTDRVWEVNMLSDSSVCF